MSASQNLFLASLTPSDMALIRPHLHSRQLNAGEQICWEGDAISHIMFPDRGFLASITLDSETGSVVEIDVVGYSGLIGIDAVYDVPIASFNITVQIAGTASIIGVPAFQTMMNSIPTFRAAARHYAHHRYKAMVHSVACGMRHPLINRIVTRLLLVHDQVEGDRFICTQHFLAEALAVRRASVNHINQWLREDGCVRYHRGYVTVVDRKRLEQQACPCYRLRRWWHPSPDKSIATGIVAYPWDA